MKKFFAVSAIALAACSAVALSACDYNDGSAGGNSAEIPVISGSVTEPETPEIPQTPAQNAVPEMGYAPLPVSLLDDIDVAAAFGDDGTDDWSFAISTRGEMGAEFSLSFISNVTDNEKFHTELSAEAYLTDAIGLKSNPENAVGFDVAGEGAVGVNLGYLGPLSDGERVVKNFEAGLTHDADWLYFKSGDGSEESYALDGIVKTAASELKSEMFSDIVTAAMTVPENLKNGFGLRFAVEKLIDLGFKAEISEEDGVSVRLSATKGYFTDLLNDALYGLLPVDWLDYIPRLDLRYTSDVFDIFLAFDADGVFKEFSVYNDVNINISYQGILFDSVGNLKLDGSVKAEATV